VESKNNVIINLTPLSLRMMCVINIFMKETPCEYIVWNGLPVIRREFAIHMIQDFNLNQKETAEKLGVTAAAVSQYVSGKRGKNRIENEMVLKEIKKSAENIIENGTNVVQSETCRICKIMLKHDLFSFLCNECVAQA
jgi:uncharacterized protein